MFDRTRCTTPLGDFDVITIGDNMTGFPGFGISGAPPNNIILDVASSQGRDFVFLSMPSRTRTWPRPRDFPISSRRLSPAPDFFVKPPL
jgi:hypothetical protein